MNKPMTMSCECTESVTSIVVIPSTNTVVFNVQTATVLSDGTALSPTSETTTVELAADSKLLAELLALVPAKEM